MLGYVSDHLIAVENKVVGAPGLTNLAIDVGFQFQFMRIANKIGRDEIRANRREIIQRLAEHPLPAAFKLKVASREVLRGAISRYVFRSNRFGNISGFLAHHNEQ